MKNNMKPMMTKQVTNAATLRMLERAGIISEPPPHVRPTGKRWGTGYSYVDGETGLKHHKGRRFAVQYCSGCFYPFVFEPVSYTHLTLPTIYSV